MRKENLIGTLIALATFGGLIACVPVPSINNYPSLRLQSTGDTPIVEHASAQVYRQPVFHKPSIATSTPITPDWPSPTPRASEAPDLFSVKRWPRSSSMDTSIS